MFVAILPLFVFNGFSQELEPRALTNLPVGTNFFAGGYAFAKGNILLDPTVPIENLNANIHTGFLAYVRAINFFGLSGKVDAIVPYAIGDWAGFYTGVDTATSRNGFGDLRVRFSFNFLGAPAVSMSEFSSYKATNVSGFSLQITAPTGQYFSEKLINLGSNRWVFKPQWGFSSNHQKWIVESYIGLWLFTRIGDFFNGNELTQKPLYTFKVHLIRKLPKGMWLAFNVGYGIGGRTYLNDELRDTRISTTRLSIIYALPVAVQHTLKFAFTSGIRFEKGSDFDAISLTYQYRWNRAKK